MNHTRIIQLRLLLILLLLGLLINCVRTAEFDATEVDKTQTPQSVIAEPAISHGKVAGR